MVWKISKKATSILGLFFCCCGLFSCAASGRKTETPYSKYTDYRLSALLSHRELPKKQLTQTKPPQTVLSTAALTKQTCYSLLKRYGVGFQVVSKKKATGVRMPIRLTGTIDGFRITSRNKRVRNSYLDCRLAVAMVQWVNILSTYGFSSIEYSSIYRRNARVRGGSKISGHAHGLAIDIGKFTLGGQRTLDVLDDWVERDRGDDPCSKEYDEPVPSQLMRKAVCEAGAQKLFQVVLTPHYNRDHANHIHLEIVPGAKWEYIR